MRRQDPGWDLEVVDVHIVVKTDVIGPVVGASRRSLWLLAIGVAFGAGLGLALGLVLR